MKPGPFEYRRARDLDHALALLAEAGDDAKVIAGGQSLVAMMSLRLARPAALIDIDRVPGLSHVLPDGPGLRIGALARHAQLEHHPAPLPGFEVLRDTARLVGHVPIRTRGTFGGSIAHADAAAEWCVIALLYGARVHTVSPRGPREHAADGFFHGLFATALEADELVSEVRLPRGFEHAAVEEFARRHGDFATALAGVGFAIEAGRIVRPRVVLGGVADRPLIADAAQHLLHGAEPALGLFEEAGRLAAADLEPPADLHGSSEYRRRLAATLTTRALVRAAGLTPPSGTRPPDGRGPGGQETIGRGAR